MGLGVLQGHILQFQWLIEATQDCCFHHTLPDYAQTLFLLNSMLCIG
jgi:hypothetical protein